MTNDDSALRGTLRERKKEQTRRAIHEAAQALVEDRGLHATTIEQICEAADVSQRTFFNYYPSKAAAVLGLPETAFDPEAIAQFEAARGELVPALCSLIGGVTERTRAKEQIKGLIGRHPELGPVFHQWTASLRQTLVSLAAERAAEPDRASDAVALVISAVGLAINETPAEDESSGDRLLHIADRIVAARAARIGA